MSQHDYNLIDQAGSSFRADLNNALLAIISNNSGATEPAAGPGGRAYMFWADTTTGLLKQRNAADTAWITLMTLSTGVMSANAALNGSTSQDFNTKILTVDNLLKLKAGANIVSAGTVNLSTATGNIIHITGTTTTTAFTMAAGQQMVCIADGAWPLTYHATTLKLNTGSSYTCTAGDILHIYYDGTTTFVNITKVGTSPAFLASTQTWTAPQRGTVTDNTTSLSFNLNTSNNFKCSVSTSSAITFTNIPTSTTGQSGSILFVQTGSASPTRATYTHITDTDLITLGTAGTYLLSYAVLDGVNVECVVSGKLA